MGQLDSSRSIIVGFLVDDCCERDPDQKREVIPNPTRNNALLVSHTVSQSQASQAIPAGTVVPSIAGPRVTAARSVPPG